MLVAFSQLFFPQFARGPPPKKFPSREAYAPIDGHPALNKSTKKPL